MYYSSAEPLIGDTLHIELEFKNIGFVEREKPFAIYHLPGEKPLGARTRLNQQRTNRTRATLVGGKGCHQCANTASLFFHTRFLYTKMPCHDWSVIP